jgi:lysophospholipase L1-like esterase
MKQPTTVPVKLSWQRRLLFSLMFIVVLLLTGLGVGEWCVQLLAPQNLHGRWSEAANSGLHINRANWTAYHGFQDLQVTYRFNEYHLRGGQVPAGKRVLVLGDSFTFGWLLEEPATYVQRLADQAEREFGPEQLAFLNGGKGGWGTGDYLAFLEEFGERLAPEIVVVFLNFADIHRSLSAGHYQLTDTDHLIVERVPRGVSCWRRWTDHSRLYDWLLSHSHLFHLARSQFFGCNRMCVRWRPRDRIGNCIQGKRQLDPPDEATIAEGTLLGQALFRRMHQWCQARQVPLFVLTTGYQGKYHVPPEWAGPIDIAFLKTAEAFFAREGIPFKDLTPELLRAVNGQWGNFTIAGDGHPNAAGAKLVADLAWSWLGLNLHRLIDHSNKPKNEECSMQ